MSNNVDLTNCDREPIHIPGSIQPHGCLIACDRSARTILRHSENAQDMLGAKGALNGRALQDIIGAEAVHELRNALTRAGESSQPSLLFALEIAGGRTFDVAIHHFKGVAIAEFEPCVGSRSQPLDLVRTLISRVSSVKEIDRLIEATSRLVRGMFGYDRVMVYQLAEDGSGKVVGESKRPDLESFLGQHFPASDIPQQARQLYLRNTIRIISDSRCDRVPLTPVLDDAGEPLDLSYAHLRSVSPVHCEYLRNMGVGASMSISIIIDGELWGMIACHHYGPRTLSMAQRVTAEMFGEFFSLHLSSLRQARKLNAAHHARKSLDRFMKRSVRSADIDIAIFDYLREFASLIPCDGAAVWMSSKWKSYGSTPNAADMMLLARFAEKVHEGRVWATNKLSHHFPGAEKFADVAAGVLIIPLSQRPRDYLFFFRKELVQTLNWAGNPEKSYETGPLGDRLTPRKSFAIWKEIVRRHAEPWTEEDREIAETTRTALVEVALHTSELLEEERIKAEVRQRVLNDELNHRVKNILAVIKSLVGIPSSESVSLEQYVKSLRGRIQALAFAHDQIVRGDGGGPLDDLVQAELTPYKDRPSTMHLEGPEVWLDGRAFSVMALLLHEMATNAAKYGSLSRPEGALSVTWDYDDLDGCRIQWQESGGPAVKTPSRRGFGTMLIDRSMSYDLGGESSIDHAPQGLKAWFRIPARHVRPAGKDDVREKQSLHVPAPATSAISGLRVLIVEDELLIALNLEQILMNAGVANVQTAGSSTAALDLLKVAKFDVAILDVNLGRDTSLPVAEDLVARNIPFMLTTGYGERSLVSRKFPQVRVLNKPYEAVSVVSELSLLVAKA